MHDPIVSTRGCIHRGDADDTAHCATNRLHDFLARRLRQDCRSAGFDFGVVVLVAGARAFVIQWTCAEAMENATSSIERPKLERGGGGP